MHNLLLHCKQELEKHMSPMQQLAGGQGNLCARATEDDRGSSRTALDVSPLISIISIYHLSSCPAFNVTLHERVTYFDEPHHAAQDLSNIEPQRAGLPKLGAVTRGTHDLYTSYPLASRSSLDIDATEISHECNLPNLTSPPPPPLSLTGRSF